MQEKVSVLSAKFKRRSPDSFFEYGDKMTGISKTGAPGDILYLQTGAGDQQFFCLAEPV